jgi:uncharacterized protein (TIGR00255 family)
MKEKNSMQIYSMTGFGKGEASGENFTLTTEIKTVNNRFKDFKFRMSSLFNSLEIDLRSQLEAEFRRGSFDISISYKKNEKAAGEFQVDPAKVEAFLKMMKPVFEKQNIAFAVSPVEFLRGDFYKDENEGREDEMSPLLKTSFIEAIKQLKASRLAEGNKLSEKLLEHLAVYESCLRKIEKHKSEYPDMMKDKLTQKLSEKLKDLKFDESRFMQEVIYYLEKLEIDEETNRANIHIDKLRSVLNSSGEIGRQIDFLLQELGRETNTMGSKSAHPEISNNVVEMKVQLEKIREQALNLE